jgi:hypothetical protein
LRRNCLIKHVIEIKLERRIETTGRGGEDVSGYWMTLRKTVDIGT